MLNFYLKTQNDSEPLNNLNIETDNFPKDAVWIDLFRPTREEEKWIEKHLGFDLPTREEMREIEYSSRLYKEDGNLFMTAIMIAQAATTSPQHDAITFVLTKNQLITIRYIEPLAFKIFTRRFNKIAADERQPMALFVELLDVVVDRLADTLELVGQRLDDYSHSILRIEDSKKSREKIDYLKFLTEIGTNGDLNTQVRESLITFTRLLIFFGQACSVNTHISQELLTRITTLNDDLRSLSDYVMFLSSKVNFLLDATLGLVNIEQNNIVKIFSVAAVIFLPPMLIASIYGMNFHFMPELAWRYGYPFAIGLLVLSAWLPYQYFKRRHWL